VAAVFLLWQPSIQAAMVAYYSFDEGAGSVIQSSFGTHPMNLNNMTTPGWSEGKIGAGAYTFSGADWAEAVGSPLNGADSFSIAWWMKTLEGDKDAGIISSDPNSPTADRFMIWKKSTMIYAGGSSALPGNQLLSDGQWHHYVVTKENDVEWKLYRDGIERATATSATDFVQADGPLRFARHANASIDARWPGALDDVALWNEVVSPQTIGLIHGLGHFAGVAANDPAIGQVFDAFQAGPGGSAVAGDRTWVYTTKIAGGIGTAGGRTNTNEYIVLDTLGNGVQAVNDLLLAPIGAGTGIAHTTVDTPSTGPRTNIDLGYSLILDPGHYQAVNFSFAYGQDGVTIPFLARAAAGGGYEILAVGDTQTVTGTGTLTVGFGGDSTFELDETTRVFAGITGLIDHDNPVRLQNNTATWTDHSGFKTVGVGGTISGFTTLGRTYAFQITVVPEPSSSLMAVAGLLAVLTLWRRRR
jgi:hypothetical protein